MAAKKIYLKSTDGQVFEVDELLALESQTINYLIHLDCADNTIPAPITGNILSKAIEYCKRHSDPIVIEADLSAFDAELMNVDQATLFDLILAAKYLDIKGLLDLTCQTVVDMIKRNTPEEIRNMFSIFKEITPEEEEEICRKHAGAFM